MSYTKDDIKRLQESAEAGDASAQNVLGCAFSSGNGVVKDLFVATSWFEKSAKQGDLYGQYNLGLHYRCGYGIKKDIHCAVEWFQKMAEWKVEYGTNAKRICGLAANHLGEIYENGYKPTSAEILQGVHSFPLNREEAFYWYDKGSVMNDDAKFNLARCYEFGLGVTKNPRKAYELYDECKTEKAKTRQQEILKYFIPLLDTRLGNVPLLRENPYRILGVWSNAKEREIRANISKIQAMLNVGKEIIFPSDHVLPCTYADYISFYTIKKERFEQKGNEEIARNTQKIIIECQRELETWKQLQYERPDWNDKPQRYEQHVNKAIHELNSNVQRIKYAFFWFCNVTDKDDEALNCLKDQKEGNAYCLWNKLDNFSACINLAMLFWRRGDNEDAVAFIMKVIHNEGFMKDFISAVCSNNYDISEAELSHIFWDALYEIPETELSWRDIDKFRKNSWLSGRLTEDDKAYIEKKSLSIIRKPLDDALQFAESRDIKNFSESLDAYDKLARLAPYQLLRIKRYLGIDDYRYKLICDNIAIKLLEFAIHYNNDNKDWSAPSSALRLATAAKSFAVDPTLQERCSRNVVIFKRNKQITYSNKIVEEIDKLFSSFNVTHLNINETEQLVKDVKLRLVCLETEIGKQDELYLNVSDSSVNRILSIVIEICNLDKGYFILSPAQRVVKQLHSFSMTVDTNNRLERNERILDNNIEAAFTTQTEVHLNKKKTQRPTKRVPSVSELTETRIRRMHKVYVSIISFAAIVGIIYYLLWNDNWNYLATNYLWWLCICTGSILVIASFVVMMWALEAQTDPYDSDLYWLESCVDKLYNIGNELENFDVRYGKSYSWPLAIPFQILALIIMVIKYPLKWIAKLATLVK